MDFGANSSIQVVEKDFSVRSINVTRLVFPPNSPVDVFTGLGVKAGNPGGIDGRQEGMAGLINGVWGDQDWWKEAKT